MKLDEETIDKIREAYRRLDEVCNRIPSCDCEGCPLRLRRGRCILKLVWGALSCATGDPT